LRNWSLTGFDARSLQSKDDEMKSLATVFMVNSNSSAFATHGVGLFVPAMVTPMELCQKKTT
jgi:hypothetical protein